MFPTLTDKLDPDIYMDGMAELARLSAARAILTTDTFAPELALRVPCQVIASLELATAVGDGQVDSFEFHRPLPADIAFDHRPLKRIIQQKVEDPLSDRMLSGEFEDGDTISIDLLDDEIVLACAEGKERQLAKDTEAVPAA